MYDITHTCVGVGLCCCCMALAFEGAAKCILRRPDQSSQWPLQSLAPPPVTPSGTRRVPVFGDGAMTSGAAALASEGVRQHRLLRRRQRRREREGGCIGTRVLPVHSRTAVRRVGPLPSPRRPPSDLVTAGPEGAILMCLLSAS